MTTRCHSDAEFLHWRSQQDAAAATADPSTPATMRDLCALEDELTRVIRDIEQRVERMIGGPPC